MPQPEDHWICDLIKGADPVFTTLFTAEMLLKWWGLGLWQYQHSYFRDAWNWLDFVIVVEGLFSTFTAGTGVNFQGLRTFRVLRPLRTITHLEGACVGWVAACDGGWLGRMPALTHSVCCAPPPPPFSWFLPGLRVVVNALLLSLPLLVNTLLVCVFYFLIFGIVCAQVCASALSHVATQSWPFAHVHAPGCHRSSAVSRPVQDAVL